jgi:catalase-peroxidase
MVAALIADGFRNYLRAGHPKPAEEQLVERANMLTLTAPEMTVLVGGMRALNAKQISTATRILAEVIASDDRRCKVS